MPVPRLGLATPFRRPQAARCRARGGDDRAWRIAPPRAARPDGEDERKALEPLLETVEAGRSPADRLLAEYRGPWRGDIDKVFDAEAF